VTARGGDGIAVRCDHTDDAQVEALFERIAADHGKLDILVNNAWSGYDLPPDPPLPFWQIDVHHWDLMFDGGLRAVVTASRLAAPLMIGRGRGLIVNTTWVLDKPHGHAFYGVVKNGTNKFTEQMADDLPGHGVAVVAVSPGFMRPERMSLSPDRAATTESPEFYGRGVAALAADTRVLDLSGRVLTTPELARSDGFADVDGSQLSGFWQEHLGGAA
jgi:NAD(P)-dependent dehydrogenase (short-subunit alcohol dehydrogenase family)